jgi:ferritin-like metal-binding protein YciE
MNVTNLRDLYIAELQEIRSVEGQLIEALPRMAHVAGHPELKQVLLDIQEEKRTDERLSMHAKRMINLDAAAT